MSLNSIIYSVFCVSFPVLFTKLDNYSEYEAGWPATKPVELLSSRTYRVAWKVVWDRLKGVRGSGCRAPAQRLTVFSPIYLMIVLEQSVYQRFLTLRTLHSFFSLFPSVYNTHTHTHARFKKQLEKPGALKMGQSRGCQRPICLSAY